MNKSELVRKIWQEQEQLTLAQIKDVVETAFDLIGDALAANGVARLGSLGVFHTKPIKERRRRNPRTGDAVLVPSQIVVKYKPSKTIKERVNAKQ
jgi:nucleoid DNA-binding protein